MAAPGAAGGVTELRLLASTGDEDGDLRPGSIFFEEAIGGFQQEAFPAANHLRNCRLHLRGTGEVQKAALGVVGAVEVDVSSWYRVEDGWKRQHPGIEVEFALNVRLDFLVFNGL